MKTWVRVPAATISPGLRTFLTVLRHRFSRALADRPIDSAGHARRAGRMHACCKSSEKMRSLVPRSGCLGVGRSNRFNPHVVCNLNGCGVEQVLVPLPSAALHNCMRFGWTTKWTPDEFFEEHIDNDLADSIDIEGQRKGLGHTRCTLPDTDGLSPKYTRFFQESERIINTTWSTTPTPPSTRPSCA